MNSSSDFSVDFLAIGLNLIWPGIGQIYQGRRARGSLYLLTTLGLFGLLIANPNSGLVAVALLGVAVWSFVDLRRLGPAQL